MNTGVEHEAALSSVDRAYDSPPFWYDIRGFLILCFSYRSTLWAQVRLFGSNMGPTHLEGAIGTATLFCLILWWRRRTGRPQSETVGFDYAEKMLQGAVARLKNDAHVALVRRDVAQLDFENEAFDTANIANALHCFPNVAAALVEMARVLKPNGTLALNALITPRGPRPLRAIANRINRWGIRKGILNQVFEPHTVIEHLKSAGFEIIESTISGNTLNVVARKPAGVSS